jgi:hypothetical protein
MTLHDIYALFYILVRQNQHQNPNSVMSFPLQVFKTLPKKPVLAFVKKQGRLFVSIPVKPSDRKKKKSRLFVPDTRIITN